MKVFLPFLFILLSLSARAQWELFPHNQVSYYRPVPGTDTYMDMYLFKQDSITKVGAWDALLFNHAFDTYRTINATVENVKSCYYDAQATYGNTDTLNLGPLYRQNDVYQYFANGDTLTFYADALLNQQWIINCKNGGSNIDQLRFACQGITADTIFGVPDSVKSFSIETLPLAVAPYHNFTIRLSKTFGLLDFIPFYYLLNHQRPAYAPIITLRGFETATLKAGYRFNDFLDYFSIQPGTILTGSRSAYLGYKIFEDVSRSEITSLTVSGDTMITIGYMSESGGYTYDFYGASHWHCCGYDTGTYTINKKDYINLFNKSIHQVTYATGGHTFDHTTPDGIHYSGVTAGDSNYISFELRGIIDTSCTIYPIPFMFESCDDFTYSKGLGLSSWCSGHNTGSPYGESGYRGFCPSCAHLVPTGIEPVLNKNEIVIFPNPASDFISLVLPLKDMNNARIEILDLMGSVVESAIGSGKQTSVDVSHLPNGIYIVRLLNGKETYFKRISIGR